MSLSVRRAQEQDSAAIHELISNLAVFEHMEQDVRSTPETVHKWLFEEKFAHALIGQVDETLAGFLLYYFSFSTFESHPQLYVEDLFVLPAHRSQGLGKALLSAAASIALEKGCARMDWQCLDWNTKAQDVYEALGAQKNNQWIPFRLQGDKLQELAKAGKIK
jgi:GNAT superfamily N-acetyltransferase